eukprot:s1_g2050.t1
MLSLPIQTERLSLREFTWADIDAMHAYASREDVVRYLTWGPNDRQESEVQLSTFLEATDAVPRLVYELALTSRPGGRLIGALCLYLDHHEGALLQSAELGFVLHSDFWGKGLVTEAAGSLLSRGISDLGLSRIWATCDARNLGSIRVLQKIGMTQEARVTGARETSDGIADELRFGFTAPGRS